MKPVPTEAELLEILQLAKGAAEKAKKLHDTLLLRSGSSRNNPPVVKTTVS